MRVTLHDASRDRDVPLTIYLPADDERHPVVIFSHGLGEDRDSYGWFGRAMAANGFVAIHLTHIGSDKDVIRQRGWIAIWKSTRVAQNWINRPLDVSFVLDRLAARDPMLGTVPSRVDMSHVAVAGHSAGAFTSMVVAGARTRNGESFRDPRVGAAIAMSMPKMEMVLPRAAYESIQIPVLHMTGTRDRSILYWTFPHDRRAPYDATVQRGDQWLVTIRGACHETFSDPDERSRGAEHARRELAAKLSAEFLMRAFGGSGIPLDSAAGDRAFVENK